MGLFSKRTTCTVCNCNESKKSLADGYICKDCISKCYPYIITMSWKNYKTDEIRMAISKSEKNKELLEIFTPTKTFKKMLITNCGCMEHQILFLILMTLFLMS